MPDFIMISQGGGLNKYGYAGVRFIDRKHIFGYADIRRKRQADVWGNTKAQTVCRVGQAVKMTSGEAFYV